MILFILFSVYLVWPYFPAIAMGGVLAAVLFPLHERSLQKGWSTGRSVSTLTFAGVLVILIPVSLLILLGTKAAIEKIPAYVHDLGEGQAGFLQGMPLVDWVQQTLEPYVHVDLADLKSNLRDFAQKVISQAGVLLSGLLSSIPKLALQLALTVVSAVFFLLESHRIGYLVKTNPLFSYVETKQLIRSFQGLCSSMVLATVVTGFAQAIVIGIGALIAGVSNVTLIAFAVFMMSFIPVVGSAPLTFALAALQFLQSGVTSGVIMIVFAIMAAMVDNFVRPWVMGSGSSMHPLVAIVSVIAGLEAFGFPGLFLGPLVIGLTIDMFRVISTPKAPAH